MAAQQEAASEMIEQLAKAAYEFHYQATASGREIWEWDDIPSEAREHWRKLVTQVLTIKEGQNQKSVQPA